MNHSRSISRYLVPFHPKRLPHYFTDVLVIGSGLAGMRAANAVSEDLRVLVVTKDKVKHSNSNFAQGGIAGVMRPDDSFTSHTDDTLDAGGTLCNRDVVEMVVREAPQRIHELIEWGAQFDREDGDLVLGREGGHNSNRIVHAMGDSTGREIMRAVVDWTAHLPNVDVWEHAFTLDLLTHEGVCRGAIVCCDGGQKILVWAKQTILCTGGAGQVYRETTNPSVATADGHAVAFRAGVELRDMEFMQFHPTVLYIAGSSRSLITEAIRGEGGQLVDRNGYRFMYDYDDRGELAPRDIVSKSIVTQMEKTRHPHVYLNLSHLDADFVRGRFPGIAQACGKFGIDIATDRIPVRPGAHYMIGGVTVDQDGRTTLPGLWAAGEVTSSGLHGANRLASNSLLETLVYGAHAGEAAAEAARSQSDNYTVLPLENVALPAVAEPLDVTDIRNSLQSLMWRSAAVQRTGADLADALVTLEYWTNYVLERQFDYAAGWELQNLLTVSRLILQAALQREESRGVHQRSDFPETDDQNWKRHLTCRVDAY